MILEDFVIVNEKKYLLKIDVNRRRYIKYSISKESYLELPSSLSKDEREEQIEKIKKKMIKYILKNEERLNTEKHKMYQTGDVISLFDRSFTLDVSFHYGREGRAELKEDIIYLKIPASLSIDKKKLFLSKLINKIIIKEMSLVIKEKVNYFNNLYFKEKLTCITLKNNSSKFGSCSSDNKISISTSLLFFPEKIVDYVIIHELCHTKELNHSKSFWSLVESILPDYKKRRKFLKDNHYKYRV
jgi:predicted metal-dependent hydrolase